MWFIGKAKLRNDQITMIKKLMQTHEPNGTKQMTFQENNIKEHNKC